MDISHSIVLPTMVALKILLGYILPVSANTIIVANFENGETGEWTEKVFSGKTKYTVRPENGNNSRSMFLQAESVNSASGLYRRIEIDLMKTPCVSWRWRIGSFLNIPDETKKAGDDFVARIYLIFSNTSFLSQAHIINYVWASKQPIGATWTSPYSNNFKMVSIQTGNTLRGKWIQENRNVFEDYISLVNQGKPNLTGIAIMTDTDNTGGEASANYGNIFFSNNC